MIPVICFVGKSGSGKTTLLEKLIPKLRRRNVRTALVKHTHHSGLCDKEGTDTDRLAGAGSTVTILHGQNGISLFTPSYSENPPLELLTGLQDKIDLVIAEGYKYSDFPKIVVRFGNEPSLPELLDFKNLVGVVCDLPIETNLAVFSFEEMDKLADWIREFFEI